MTIDETTYLDAGRGAIRKIRRYDSLAHREESEDAFYGSDEWRQGPREAIIALIESYTEIVLELDEVIVRGLRK